MKSTLNIELAPSSRASAAAVVADLGTILGIWAHPDDEAYLSAGIMRLALENGQRVVCATATAGERGTDEPLIWPPEALGPARRMELRSSFEALATGLDGSIEHHWLGHRDGRCTEIRTEVAAAEIGRLIDRVGPDTVLTFDPGGVTGHADHQAVSTWVRTALSTRPHIALRMTAISRTWVDQFGDEVDIRSFFEDGYPIVIDDPAIELDIVLDDELWSIKDAALRAHSTQVSAVIEELGPDLWKAFNLVESFAIAGERD